MEPSWQLADVRLECRAEATAASDTATVNLRLSKPRRFVILGLRVAENRIPALDAAARGRGFRVRGCAAPQKDEYGGRGFRGWQLRAADSGVASCVPQMEDAA